jgi:alkyl hydroperoxide reductase subunit F
VLALLQVGGHPPKEGAELLDQVKALEGDFVFETYFSLSCQNCPDVVQALNLMAVLNPRMRHVAIDGALFQAEVEARKVMAVPHGLPERRTVRLQGRMELAQILAKLDTGAAARAAEKIAAKEPFDVLVVGGGPAGAAAAIYAARKGIRTGVGRTLRRPGARHHGDREFHLVSYTEGPKLAAALEAACARL